MHELIHELKVLLEHLDGPDAGVKLWEASSLPWQAAIREAVGAKPTTDAAKVARALHEAMARPNNQFAILMRRDCGPPTSQASRFEATFPSDVVCLDDSTCWVECRLRDVDTDKLLVTMGISLLREEEGGPYKIHDLQWQDFRDEFYPGLSGREWLRAF